VDENKGAEAVFDKFGTLSFPRKEIVLVESLRGISGATRLVFVIGHPIRQIKSPPSVTASLRNLGMDTVVVPAHVLPVDLDAFIAGASLLENLDGLIITVPHKFAARGKCEEVSESSDFLGSVNVMRRRLDRRWYGDMLDGLGFVGGLVQRGYAFAGKRALLVGAGGAGSAVAFELLTAGLNELALFDQSVERVETLRSKLRRTFPGKVIPGSDNPAGFDLVVNATPVGMGDGQGTPVDVTAIKSSMIVADLVTVPEVTPLLAAARAIGCRTQTGVEMYEAQLGYIVDFLRQVQDGGR
jgi:shikimate dehydrogenase